MRRGKQDFYTNEPVLLTNQRVFMPRRWFVRGTGQDSTFYAMGWNMQTVDTEGTPFWRVVEGPLCEVGLDEILLPFPEFQQAVMQYPDLYPFPPPSQIRGKWILWAAWCLLS
jgi:hypothetical protein